MSYLHRRLSHACVAVATCLAVLCISSATPAQILMCTLTVVVSDQDTEQTLQGAAVTVNGSTAYAQSNGAIAFLVPQNSTAEIEVAKTGFDSIEFSVNINGDIIKGVSAELRTTFTLDSGPQYQVKNGSGTIVARFDQDGNVDVNGSITYNASSGQLAATSGKELLIKHGSTIVARLDASGNLYLKGDFQRRLSSISLGSAEAFRVKNASGTTVAAIDQYGNLRIVGGSNGF